MKPDESDKHWRIREADNVDFAQDKFGETRNKRVQKSLTRLGVPDGAKIQTNREEPVILLGC